jgi:hypothetical protein
MTTTTHTRVALRFDGELDDVPLAAAAAVADMAHALLQHSDEHAGRSAAMRLARWGPLLNLWLTDPECSPACLGGDGQLPTAAGRADTSAGDVRLTLSQGPDEGLRLHWALVLADETKPGYAVPSQRTAADGPT